MQSERKLLRQADTSKLKLSANRGRYSLGLGTDNDHVTVERLMPLRVASTEGLSITRDHFNEGRGSGSG